jgi:hypothetical protein
MHGVAEQPPIRVDRAAIARARAAAEEARAVCLATRQQRQAAFAAVSATWQGRLHGLVADELATLEARLVDGAAALEVLVRALDDLAAEAERWEATSRDTEAPAGEVASRHAAV